MGNTGSLIKNIVTQKKYKEKYHWTDYFSYFYLFLGVFLMFGPIIWLGLSSVKTLVGIQEYPPTILPLSQIQVEVDGYEKPLSLYNVTLEDGSSAELANSAELPSSNVTLYSDSGFSYPSTSTCICERGRIVGGYSWIPTRVLTEDNPNQIIGPNIKKTPKNK